MKLLATRALLALMAAIPVFSVGMSPSGAVDNGDGLESCNGGEICLHDLYPDERYRKHFWYGADHNGYQWWDASGNVYTGYVQNDADGIRNRDSSCSVKVVDDRGIYPDDVYVAPNDGVNKDIPSSVDNENDRHERC